MPRTESLKLVIDRLLPYWESAIVPDLAAGKTVLVTAHGNSLRGLVKHLEASATRHRRTEHPDRHPARLRARREQPAHGGPGRYLDPEAAAAGAAAVANQGKK